LCLRGVGIGVSWEEGRVHEARMEGGGLQQ
jgi:hypothetical protein